MNDWTGKHVVILGAARQGLALSRWLAQHGADVTLSDKRPEAELPALSEALRGLPIHFALGGHPIQLLDHADVLCLSGGVPTSLPIVQAAIRRNIILSNDTQIFMEAVPCKTVGITGSAGKTTTTTLVGNMAKAAYLPSGNNTISSKERGPQAYVGGNLGDPLINYLQEMQPNDLAILEISSFQLEQMELSPNVAAILNITPNHLDRHVNMEAYAAAKSRILEFQSRHDVAILGRDNEDAWNLRLNVKGNLHSFGFSKMDQDTEGTYYDQGLLVLHEHGIDIPLLRREQLMLRGDHNVMNVLASFAIGFAAGLPLDAMLTAAEEFRGVPHRLELVRTLHGAQWYNDSIATAPERSIAAIRAFSEPIILLLGGRDKNLPWHDLANLVQRRVDHLVIFGESADKIEKAMTEAHSTDRPYSVNRFTHLKEAVSKAAEISEAGDVILLSPGGTSFDEFTDFEERGEKFRVWVQELL